MRVLPAIIVLIFLIPESSAAQHVLNISGIFQNREKLDGETVTVRGIYRNDIHGDFLDVLPGHDDPDGRRQWVRLFSMKVPIHKLCGRLERSIVQVTGTVKYRPDCDFAKGGHSCSGPPVGLDKISDIKILDTLAANDPRLPDGRYVPVPLSQWPLPPKDPQYDKILKLAHEWRKAILNKDFDSLVNLSANALETQSEAARKKRMEGLTNEKGCFYNVAFQGTDSLQNQMKRNRRNPIYLGFLSQQGVHNLGRFDGGPEGYTDLEICYCLREECTEAHVASLKQVYAHNLKDPYWCFTPYWRYDRTWVIH